MASADVPPAPGPEAPERALGALHVLAVQSERHRVAVATHLGITVTEYQVLSQIVALGPMTVGDLATSLGLRSSVVTGIADRLEAKHLIVRRLDERDRRRRVLCIASDRQAELDETSELLARVFEDLEPEEVDNVSGVLEYVAARLQILSAEVAGLGAVAPPPRRLR